MEFENAKKIIENAEKICVIQAENPDGDSLGSALALEEILSGLCKTVKLFCPVDIPKYLRYFNGWDRVETSIYEKFDLFIIVDTTSNTLLSKVIEDPLYKNLLEKTPVLVIDHHTDATPDLTFDHELILKEARSAGEVIFEISNANNWTINETAAQDLLGAIFSDTLGLSTSNTSARTFEIAGELTKLGANSARLEEDRRELSKKAPEILAYKGELIRRIEYFLDGKLAVVSIPWNEIKEYSDKYNPSVLVIDEMRMVEGVEACVAIKTYPDGKLTGKIRTNSPIAADIAGYFGGGGHAYAAGFRVYENYDEILRELITCCDKIFN